MPALARNRGHRLAAYRRCWTCPYGEKGPGPAGEAPRIRSVGVRVADVLALAAPAYLARHASPLVVVAACRAIQDCRTSALGGHGKRCTQGHVLRAWYNGCRNRSCPRCACGRVRKWLERQVRTLLGCAHHHIIFTIPHELNVLWLANYRVMAEVLFATAREALFELAADPRYLGAVPGAIMALHTWGQQLVLHPHVHCLVSAGGGDSSGEWVSSRRVSMLPAEPLKRLFRGKFLHAVRGLAGRESLRLPEGWGHVEVERLCREAEHKRWNVHVCERYANPVGVLTYLGRYLNGGPISEKRLLSLDADAVSLEYKDYRDTDGHGRAKVKVLRLSPSEFVTRFLRHVSPKSLHLVRGYGLYRSGGTTEVLRQRVRAAVPISPEQHAQLTSHPTCHPTEEVAEVCPYCGSLIYVLEYPRGAPLPQVA